LLGEGSQLLHGTFQEGKCERGKSGLNSSIKLKFVNAAVSVTATQQRDFRSRTDEARRNSNQKTPNGTAESRKSSPVLDSDGSADDELAHVLESGSVVDFDSDEE
jgi:hypothetical protein